MLEMWLGEIAAMLKMNRISQRELAAELGMTEEYVSMVLNGKKTSATIEAKMRSAINEIVSKRKSC